MWLGAYVFSDKSGPAGAERPLAFGRVDLHELPGKPGRLELMMQIQPYDQINPPLTVPLSLTAEAPARK